MRVLAFMFMVLAAVLSSHAVAFAQQPPCTFGLGFQALHELIPEVVGDCRGPELFDALSGDARQPTTGGLLVWRKEDNWTAFTDGYTTWIHEPGGLTSRPSEWEHNPYIVWVQPTPFYVETDMHRNFNCLLDSLSDLTRVLSSVTVDPAGSLVARIPNVGDAFTLDRKTTPDPALRATDSQFWLDTDPVRPPMVLTVTLSHEQFPANRRLQLERCFTSSYRYILAHP